MRTYVALAFATLAASASAYRCSGEICDLPGLTQYDCEGYWEQKLNPVKRKIKVVKDRDVLFNQLYDNCDSDTDTNVKWTKEFQRQASLEVSTNNSQTLNLATNLAIGIKDVVGAQSSLSTNTTTGDGRKITTQDTIKYSVTVDKKVNPYSKMRVIVLTKAVSASNASLTQMIVGHWTDGNNVEHQDSCTVNISGSGNGAERESIMKTPSHVCAVPCATTPVGAD